MNRRHSFPIFLSMFLFIVSFSTSCLAHNPLKKADIEEVERYLRSKWVPVHYKQPLGFGTIFNELDRSFWPALPDSHEWRILEGKVYLFKHKLADDHDFDFVTYLTDSSSKFSFLSCWDGITHHSFAYTRPNSPLTSHDSARDVFPNPVFKYGGKTYMRGHCIDYRDTFGLSEFSTVGRGTRIESISTLDPRNYIPEPRDPTAYWGETVRKKLVEQIREQNGCYSHYMYYGLNPIRTNDETATVIPKGIYFVRTGPERTPLASYHVFWSGKIHEGKNDAEWEANLKGLQHQENFFPTPYIYDPSEEKAFAKLPLTYTLPKGELELDEYYKILKSADHEIQTVMGKLVLINYMLDQKYNPIAIQKWLKRLIKHAIKIHARDSYGFMNTQAVAQLLQKLPKVPKVDSDGNFSAWIHQVCENDKDEAKARDMSTFSKLKPLKITKPPVAAPVPEIDVDSYKTPADSVHAVMRTLEKSPCVRLLNLTTRRSKPIAEAIMAEYPEASKRKSFIVEYTPKKKDPNSKGAPPTAGIRESFTQVGIEPVPPKTPHSPASSSITSSADKSAPPSSPPVLLKNSRSKKVLFPALTEEENEEKFFNYFKGLDQVKQALFLQKLKNSMIGDSEEEADSSEQEEEDNQDSDETKSSSPKN